MNYLDMFILVLLVYAVFKGFTHGFIMQLALLAALLIGIFAAIKLSGFTGQLLEKHLNIKPESLYLMSIALTFILVFIGINLLGKLIEKFAESLELSLLNRLFGVLFSLCKTIVVIGIILSLADRLDRQVPLLPKNTREHSIFYHPFTVVARTIFPSLKAPDSNYNSVKEEA